MGLLLDMREVNPKFAEQTIVLLMNLHTSNYKAIV